MFFKPCRLLLIVACAALCHGQTPATTVVASPAVRHTFDSVKRAPDGRVQYIFTSQNSAVTNEVFMGGFLGGRQLLGYAPDTRTLTLSGSRGNELSLAVGGSFTQPASAATAETAGSDVVASCGTLPQNAVVTVVSASNPVIHLGARGASTSAALGTSGIVSMGPATRRVVVSGGTGVTTVQPSEYTFGTQYMYPTRFEVGTYTTPGANGGVVSIPYVVPRDFRMGGYSIQGTSK